MYVSVSAYNDGDLLEGCLDRVNELLPEATVAVIDGRYETWPAEDANSTDRTPEVALAKADKYHAAGAFPDEQAKHLHRLDAAPEGEWALFIDADERLERFDAGALEPRTAYSVRIFNPVVYSQTPIRYWPRVFRPEYVADIKSWDRYLFHGDVDVEKTAAVTIVHRHDLRDREYREAKYERFDNEGRAGRYEDGRFEQYLEDDWDVEPSEDCPECGAESVVWSPMTHDGDGLSRVGACIRGDCWIGERDESIETYRYIPDAIDEGLEEDPDRLRAELLSVGCPLVEQNTADQIASGILKHWVGENLDPPLEVVA